MVHKQVHFKSEARQNILRGATALTDAVRVTLGPKSKSVLIEKKWGQPSVLLLTEATLTEVPEKKLERPAAMDAMAE